MFFQPVCMEPLSGLSHSPKPGRAAGLTLWCLLPRTTLSKASTQKRAVVKDQQGKRVHLEYLEDVPEALQQDDLQRDLRQLLRHFCRDDLEREAK